MKLTRDDGFVHVEFETLKPTPEAPYHTLKRDLAR